MGFAVRLYYSAQGEVRSCRGDPENPISSSTERVDEYSMHYTLIPFELGFS